MKNPINSLQNYTTLRWCVGIGTVAIICLLYAGKAFFTPSLGIDLWPSESGWRVDGVHGMEAQAVRIGEILVEVDGHRYSWKSRGEPWFDAQPGEEIVLVRKTAGGEESVAWTIPPPSPTQPIFITLIVICTFSFIVSAWILCRRDPARYRGDIILLLGYGLFVTFGGVSNLQIWYSSPITHAISWMLAVGTIHLYWSLDPLLPTSKTFWAIIYVAAGVMAVLELLLLLPQSAFYLAFLFMVAVSITVLAVQSSRSANPQRIILFGYIVAFAPGTFFILMATVALNTENAGGITTVIISMIGVSLWPLFHVYARGYTAPAQRRFRQFLALSSFTLLYMTALVIIESFLSSANDVWATDAALLLIAIFVAVLAFTVWGYGRYMHRVLKLLGGGFSQTVPEAGGRVLNSPAGAVDMAHSFIAELQSIGINASLLLGEEHIGGTLVNEVRVGHTDGLPTISDGSVSLVLGDPSLLKIWEIHLFLSIFTRIISLTQQIETAEAALAANEDMRTQISEAMLLHEKMAALGQVAAHLAHELRTPLQSINTSLGISLEFPDEAHEEISRALTQVQRISDLITAVSNYSRPSADEPTLIDVNDSVHEAVTLCRQHIKDAGVAVNLHLLPNIPPVLMAPSEMTVVATNLITNACDAVAGLEQPVIDVCLENEDGVTLKVTDNGPGIKSDVMGHLFTMFFTTKPKGHGLGLYQCYNIVTGRGGRIDVMSNPGKGATFIVWLPRACESENTGVVHDIGSR